MINLKVNGKQLNVDVDPVQKSLPASVSRVLELAAQTLKGKMRGDTASAAGGNCLPQSDKLVLWGWNRGEGRTLPPLSHSEFARKFQEWERFGAACPN